MLKSTILNAIAAAKRAVADILIDVTHVTQTAPTFTPGSKPVYTSSTFPVKMAFTTFDQQEINGDTVLWTDFKGLSFPEAGESPIDVGHIIRVPSGLPDVRAGDYRVINNDRVMVGDTCGLNQLQLRFQKT